MNLNISNTQRTFYMPSEWVSRKIKIALIGLGGTGSAFINELFQLNGILQKLGGDGIHVTAYDGDTVSDSNVFRQSFWSHDVGLNKAEVLVSRFNQFGGVNWLAVPQFCTGKMIKDKNYDLIITAVDKASVRYEIGNELKDHDTQALWLDLGNDNHQANVLLGSLSSKNKTTSRLPTPFELFSTHWLEAIKDEDDTPSCSTAIAIEKQTFGINGMAARSASSMLLFPLIRFGSLKHHGLFIDIQNADISKMPVDPLQWSLYGYAEQ